MLAAPRGGRVGADFSGRQRSSGRRPRADTGRGRGASWRDPVERCGGGCRTPAPRAGGGKSRRDARALGGVASTTLHAVGARRARPRARVRTRWAGSTRSCERARERGARAGSGVRESRAAARARSGGRRRGKRGGVPRATRTRAGWPDRRDAAPRREDAAVNAHATAAGEAAPDHLRRRARGDADARGFGGTRARWGAGIGRSAAVLALPLATREGGRSARRCEKTIARQTPRRRHERRGPPVSRARARARAGEAPTARRARAPSMEFLFQRNAGKVLRRRRGALSASAGYVAMSRLSLWTRGGGRWEEASRHLGGRARGEPYPSAARTTSRFSLDHGQNDRGKRAMPSRPRRARATWPGLQRRRAEPRRAPPAQARPRTSWRKAMQALLLLKRRVLAHCTMQPGCSANGPMDAGQRRPSGRRRRRGTPRRRCELALTAAIRGRHQRTFQWAGQRRSGAGDERDGSAQVVERGPGVGLAGATTDGPVEENKKAVALGLPTARPRRWDAADDGAEEAGWITFARSWLRVLDAHGGGAPSKPEQVEALHPHHARCRAQAAVLIS